MKKLMLLLAFLGFLGMQAWAQKTITGTVTSADDGSPLPGVSVVVKGTNVGTITDVDGKYSLNVPANAKTLVFSFVGYETKEVPIDGKTIINVQLKKKAVQVQKVIVMGYYSRAKNQITGSAVQVSSKDIQNMPVTNVFQALQGKVAGLNIMSSSGMPGSVQDIRIRGIGSLTASNSPLIVIDGVPVVSGDFSGSSSNSSLSALSSLDVNDIASITVLKDAAATSAYGARGANGVIVITTKHGRIGQKTRFNFMTDYGFQNDAVPGPKPLTAQEKKELFIDAVYNSFGPNGAGYFNFTDRDSIYQWALANGLDFLNMLRDWDGKNHDWGAALEQKNAPVRNISLSATGGDRVSSYYIELNYNKTAATVLSRDFRRIGGALNYSRNLTKRIKFSTTNNISYVTQDAFLEQAAYFANPRLTKYFMSPWESIYDKDGQPNLNLHTMLFNTIYIMQHDININKLTHIFSNNYVEIQILKGLKFKSLYGLDFNLAAWQRYANRHHGDGEDVNGYAEFSDTKDFNFVTQQSLTYNTSFHGHHISLTALMEYQKNQNNYLYGYGENFPADGLVYLASASANKDATSSYSDWMHLSYLAMFNYNYKDRYILDLTFRREGSSRFAPGHRFGNFWAIGLAWNISNEPFFASMKNIFNTLRIRGSYGLTGNSNIGLNTYQALLSFTGNYADQGTIVPSTYGNTNLTWEKNRTLDVGVEFGMFNDFVTGSVSYFHRYTYDLLQAVPLSRTTGHSSQNQNVGSILNQGVETQLQLNLIRSRDFNFSIYGNLSLIKNVVKDLAKDAEGHYITIETHTRVVEVGHPLYEWKMRKWAGVDPKTGLPLWYVSPDSGKAVTSDYNEAQKFYFGKSALPTRTAGFGFNMQYKWFFVNMSGYYSGGNMVYESWMRYIYDSGLYSVYLFNGLEGLMTRWQKPGDKTDVPKIVFKARAFNAGEVSSRFLHPGDYMRIKNITVGFRVPKELLTRFGVKDLTLYVRGYNVFTWVKDKTFKWDPEVRADGFTRLTAPPVKSVIFGLNLTF